jgi:phosphoglycerate dehydrogenase-like enzyme
MSFRPPRGHWQRATRLRLLQMSGAGVDSLLPAPDLPKGVRVANARGIHGAHMSEFALAMILAFAKRIPTWLEQQEKREWRHHGLSVLRGQTVGILGLGAIGQEVARLCQAFGMRVIGTQVTPKSIAGVERVYPPEETGTVLSRSDFLVVLLPLTDATRGSIDAEQLALLPEHAVLVNLARGGIVDEDALARALGDGRLRGAALDVFAEEPLPVESPLWSAPRTILTPHVSGWFPGYAEQLAEILVDNLDRLERGAPLRNAVDPARGY